VLDAALRGGGKKPAAKPKKTYGVKPKNPAPAFRPISAQAKPFGVAQARAKKQTTKARAKVPASPKLARVPIKKSYSAPERKAIVVALKKARGKRTNRQLYNDSNQAERHYLAALGKALNKPQTSKAHAGPKQQKHGMKFTGETKLAGVVPVPGLHQLGWTVDQALKNLARPAHAVTSAAYAAQEGRSPLKGASEGFTGKRVKTGSDLLKRHGMKGIPAAILGTAGDIVLDPLNLATGGTGSAAEHLVTQGGRLLHRAAELEAVGRRADAGAMTDKAHRLLEKAKTAPGNKGIQVGVKVGRHEVKTSGALTAKLSKRLGISHSATAVRNAPVAQALGHALDPAFRPAGVSAQEWKSYRNRLRESRGEANTGIRKWERRGRAYAKALKKSGHDDAAKQVIDALERARKSATETAAKPGVLPDLPHQASIHGLPADLKPIAIAARKDLKHIGEAEKQANILERTAQNYVPHQKTRAAQKAEKKAARRSQRNPYAMRREDARPISEQHADLAAQSIKPTRDIQARPLLRTLRQAQRIATKRDLGRGGAEEYKSFLLKDGKPKVGPPNTVQVERHAHGEHHYSEYTYFNDRGAAVGYARMHSGGGRLVFVDPAYRRQGIAQRLYQRAEHDGYDIRTAGNGNVQTELGDALVRGLEKKRSVPPKFDTDLARLVALRGGKHEELMANRRLANNVVQDIARPLDKLEHLRPSDHVYVAGRGLRSIGEKLDHDAIVKAARTLQPGERFVVMPKAIGDAIGKGVVSRAAGGELLRHYDKFMHGIKTVLTALNLPAYDLRNLSGDLFLARQADTDPKSLYDGLRLVAGRTHRNTSEERNLKDAFDPEHLVDVGHGVQIKAGDLLTEMEHQGAIGTGFHGHELQEFQGHAPKRRGPLKTIRRLSGFREDAVRAGTYLAARRRGFTPAEAAEWTNKHHFDYSDLTQAERDVLRRVFPFWTFTARNTRLQAEKLVTRPARQANYGLAMDEGRKQAGLPEDYQNRLPGYYRRGLGIPVKVGGDRKLLFPQLPITDLNRLAALTNPREEFNQTAQMLNPLAKWLYEPLANHSLFFRGPIYQDAENPTAPHYVPAPGWLKALPMDVRTALAGGNKDAAKQGLWTAKADYLGRLTPQQNTLTQVTTQKVGSRNQDWRDALISQMTGVKINQYDGQKFKIDKLYEARSAIDAKLTDMRKLKTTHRHEYKVLLAEKRRISDKIEKARVKHGDIPKPKKKTPVGASIYGSGTTNVYGSGSSNVYGSGSKNPLGG
jgi:GNAT superfamily N-acetyltransferase